MDLGSINSTSDQGYPGVGRWDESAASVGLVAGIRTFSPRNQPQAEHETERYTAPL